MLDSIIGKIEVTAVSFIKYVTIISQS